MKLDLRDVEFQAFRGSSNGGQNVNKVSNCVRAIHVPTGLVVKATRERSLHQNKKAAIAELQRRLSLIERSIKAHARKVRWNDKPDAGFGSKPVRTLRLVGSNQGLTDHRTGITYPANESSVGESIDHYLISIRRDGKSSPRPESR